MTEIHVPFCDPKILQVVESYEAGKRYRWTSTRWTKPDGNYHINVHCQEVADEGNLLYIAEGPDVDASAVHDLTQWAKLKPKKQREKPDIVAAYHRYNEVRLWELSDRKLYPVAKMEEK